MLGHSIIFNNENTLVYRCDRAFLAPAATATTASPRNTYQIPPYFVVKVFNSDIRYEREKSSYDKMHSVQGGMVPKFFGVTRWHDNYAIAMEFLDGKMLVDPIFDSLQIGHLRNVLSYCYESLTQLGVCQSNPKLGNVMVVELRGWSYMRRLPQMIFWSTFQNFMAVPPRARWQLLPIIYRIVIIDFDWAQLDYEPDYLRNTNRNDAISIVKQLERWRRQRNPGDSVPA